MRNVAALLVLLAASCSPLLEFERESSLAGLEAHAASPNLVLTNHGEEPIFHLAMEHDFAAVALFAPCTDPDQCARLDPGQRKQIPLSEVPGYEPGREQQVIVYWWRLVPDGDGRWRVERMQSTQVRVPAG